MALIEIVTGLSAIAVLMYVWISRQYSYWTRRQVKQLNPSMPYGNLKEIIMTTENMGVAYDKLYRAPEAIEEPAIGIYKLFSPQLLIRDPDLIKDVLVKEFSSIHDNELDLGSSDIISQMNPFIAKGDKWKKLRSVSTQGLTTSRVKNMVVHIKTVCQDLHNYLMKNLDIFMDGKVLGGKFTADVVTGCVYGINGNCFTDPDSVYRKYITKTFDLESFNSVVIMLSSICPSITRFFNLRFISSDVENFFTKIVTDVVNYRKDNNVQREDFLQHIINIKDKDGKSVYSMKEMMAHSMTFILDGFETSSVLISHILDLLSQHPEEQNRLRDELNNKINSIDDINFDLINSLPYLDAVVNESLRLRPPGTVLIKRVTKDVTLRSGNKTYDLQKGTSVAISLFSIMRDERNFEDPLVFNPSRFLNNTNYKAFLPFSSGPRACLGSKFALTQVKACIATIIKYFEIFPQKSRSEMGNEFDPKSFLFLNFNGGIQVKFKPVK